MILEWRAASGPIGPMAEHNEPAEWQYQTAMCSQTFEELPDQLEQLIIRREAEVHNTRGKSTNQKHQAEGKPAKELMLEFRHLATNLRNWPERMLVHYFKESLDEEMLKICLCCELPDDKIHEWYRIAIAMDNALKQHRRNSTERQPGRQLMWCSAPRQAEGRQTAATPTSISASVVASKGTMPQSTWHQPSTSSESTCSS
ncbi:hypothetical protein E2320_004564 [Naja naja]|nr:hypothetical protein E2320_004564 [Naja naja]